jgi:hypothetical protein
MKPEMLAHLRGIMRREIHSSIAVTQGERNRKEWLRRRSPGVTSVTPVTPCCGETIKAVRESFAPVADEGPDLAEIVERVGMAADRVPAIYLENWARLNYRGPPSIAEADWRRALADGGLFLDGWAGAAAALGWTAADVFAVAGGLVWRLAGRSVEALYRDRARLDDGRSLERK